MKIKSATVQHSQIVILVMLLRLNVLSECIDVITVLIPRDIKIKEGARKSWPLNTHKYLLVSICFRNKEQMTEAFWVLWQKLQARSIEGARLDYNFSFFYQFLEVYWMAAAETNNSMQLSALESARQVITTKMGKQL